MQEVDIDKDGAISFEEFNEGMKKMLLKSFNHDPSTNKNGRKWKMVKFYN